jgi:hypothetical protein
MDIPAAREINKRKARKMKHLSLSSKKRARDTNHFDAQFFR